MALPVTRCIKHHQTGIGATRVNDAKLPFLTDGSPYDARYAQLKSVELDARGLDHFGAHDLRILKDLPLPSSLNRRS